VLVIGDYTRGWGIHPGRSKTRPILSAEQIDENTQTYLEQAYLVLDHERPRSGATQSGSPR
jgi:tyrosyl-tRNA synthetase